jgi:hypothetical protein
MTLAFIGEADYGAVGIAATSNIGMANMGGKHPTPNSQHPTSNGLFRMLHRALGAVFNSDYVNLILDMSVRNRDGASGLAVSLRL